MNQTNNQLPIRVLQTTTAYFTVNLPIWQEHHDASADNAADEKAMQGVVAKPLHKQIAEHKDVTKIVIQLNGILSGMKPDVNEVLKEFKVFEELWASVSNHSLKVMLLWNFLELYLHHLSSWKNIFQNVQTNEKRRKIKKIWKKQSYM